MGIEEYRNIGIGEYGKLRILNFKKQSQRDCTSIATKPIDLPTTPLGSPIHAPSVAPPLGCNVYEILHMAIDVASLRDASPIPNILIFSNSNILIFLYSYILIFLYSNILIFLYSQPLLSTINMETEPIIGNKNITSTRTNFSVPEKP